MWTKRDRINQAYEYLRNKGIVHTQKDVAQKMGASTSNVSSAFKGDENVLTDKFIKRFNHAFDDLFNMDWLLGEEVKMIKEDNITQISHGDYSSNINGNSNNVNNSQLLDKAIDEISEHRRLIQEQVRLNKEQFDRFMSVIERLTNK